MSKPLNIHTGGTVTVIAQVPGLGITDCISDTTTTAGTGAGFAVCCLLRTTTTGKLYVNTGTTSAATWTVAGSQS